MASVERRVANRSGKYLRHLVENGRMDEALEFSRTDLAEVCRAGLGGDDSKLGFIEEELDRKIEAESDSLDGTEGILYSYFPFIGESEPDWTEVDELVEGGREEWAAVGICVSGVPYASHLSDRYGIPLHLVEMMEDKGEPLPRFQDVTLDEYDYERLLLVEDSMSTGMTALTAAEALSDYSEEIHVVDSLRQGVLRYDGNLEERGDGYAGFVDDEPHIGF